MKTYCKQHKCNLAGKYLVAQFKQAKHRWYDPEALLNLMNEKEHDAAAAMDLIVSKSEVDEKVLKTLIKSGKIREDIVEQSYREEDAQMTVNILEK